MRQASLRALILALALIPSLGRAQGEASSSSDPPASTAVLPDTLLPWQRALNESDQAWVDSLQVLITELRGQAQYAEAIGPAEEALRIRRAAQRDDHWETGDAARLVATLRHVAALEPEAQARLAEVDRSNDEARRLFSDGDYEATAALLRWQLAIRREILGDAHTEVALTIDDLACVLCILGDYARAEPLYRQALLLNLQVRGAGHPESARAMNNLATALSWQGNHEAAIAYSRDALATNRRLLGDDHPHVVYDLDNLGVFLSVTGAHAEAEEASREAVARAWAAFGAPSQGLADCLSNLACHLGHKGDHRAAEATMREALAMGLALYDENERAAAEWKFCLALALVPLGEFVEAEGLYRQALAVFEAESPRNPYVALIKFCLAEVLQLKGDYHAAEAAWGEARASFDEIRKDLGLRGFDRVKFTENWAPHHRLAACLARGGKARSAWEHLETGLARGLLDEVKVRNAHGMTDAEYAARDELLSTLVSIDDHIRALVQAGDTSSMHGSSLDSLRWEGEKQRAALSILEVDLAAWHGDLPGEWTSLEDLQSHLAEDEAIVAWVDVSGNPHAADPNGEHWACVVRSTGEPHWARVPGSGESGAWTKSDDLLPELVWKELAGTQRAGQAEGSVAMRRLYRQRIEPVEDHLRGVRHLITIPSGLMTKIPPDVLTDMYTGSFVPSATLWVYLRHKRSNGVDDVTFLGVGDPVLDGPAGEDASRTEDEPVARLRSMTCLPLPGSRAEIEAIARLFEGATGGSVPTVLLGPAAREQRLCEAAASGELEEFRYIHFATHAVMNDRVPMQSSLVLSREDLADAVDRAARGEAVYDGVITAEQILHTWNLDADLVTLSACETALGREYRGEGCLGFSQVLFVAGARSLLLSLWKVEDRATMLLMTRFYENMLGAHWEPRAVGGRVYETRMPLPKAEALREAKEWLRTLTAVELRAMEPVSDRVAERGLVPVEEPAPASPEDHPYAHPHFWAAFILIGDPR